MIHSVVFRTIRHGNIPTGTSPLTGALSADGVGKIVIPEQYLASSRAVNRW